MNNTLGHHSPVVETTSAQKTDTTPQLALDILAHFKQDFLDRLIELGLDEKEAGQFYDLGVNTDPEIFFCVLNELATQNYTGQATHIQELAAKVEEKIPAASAEKYNKTYLVILFAILFSVIISDASSEAELMTLATIAPVLASLWMYSQNAARFKDPQTFEKLFMKAFVAKFPGYEFGEA